MLREQKSQFTRVKLHVSAGSLAGNASVALQWRRFMTPSPIFVCGPARSGTTLLVRLLDSHPDVAVLPEETYLYQDLLLRRTLSWCVIHLAETMDLPRLPAILSLPPFRRFSFAGAEHLRRRLEIWVQSFGDFSMRSSDVIDTAIPKGITSDRYWQTFLDLYDRLVPGSLDASRYWLEKTPSNERFVSLHERAFSGACRYLHVLRDPRDMAASMLKRWSDRGADERDREFVRICYLWSLSVHLCARGLKAYSGRYYAIRYEDLVRCPVEVMNGVCRFLDIEMNERVLMPTRLGNDVSPNSSYEETESASGVISSQVGRFREVLSPAQVRFIENLLRDQMTACGYSTEGSDANRATVGPPLLPPGAGVWQCRMHRARAWKMQREFAGRSLFGHRI
jgi:hypothetical protein